MRSEISRLHERLGTTFIYVTHDQVEAMTMGTRIVVMKDGFVQQIDTPVNLYKYPDNVFVAGFIGTPQMNFFDGTVIKEGDDVTFNLDCGASVGMKYVQADKVPVKYMDGNHKVVFGIRPDDVRVKNDTNYDDGSWAPAKAVVSVVEVLGGETLIYANLNLNTPDAEEGAIIIKASPDTIVRRGDILDIEISRRKFHVFDKETEMSIRKRIPEASYIRANVEDGKLTFEGQAFEMPSAVKCDNATDVETVIPISALTLGAGAGKAKVQWVENVEGKNLYFLKVGDLTMFSLEEGEARFKAGDIVDFDIDFTKVGIEALGIAPINLTNTLDGTFTKEKDKSRKFYNFYMNVGAAKLIPTVPACQKIFACKGSKIFRTPLEYIFDASVVTVTPHEEGATDVLTGTVSEIRDYGFVRYATIDTEGQKVVAAYDGAVGDQVDLHVPAESIVIKDKSIEIIIA